MINKVLLIMMIVFFSYSFSNAQLKKGSLWAGEYFSYGSFVNRINQIQEPQAKDKTLTVRPFVGISTS